jgi:hypothetical protein
VKHSSAIFSIHTIFGWFVPRTQRDHGASLVDRIKAVWPNRFYVVAMIKDSLTSSLHVNTITLANISSDQQFDVSNYYVTLSYGVWKVSTTLNQNSGREICWKSPQSDLNMLFDASIDELISQKFHVHVWNHDGNHLHGSGSCTLESSLKSLTNNVICISIFLVDKDMKEFGIANILIHVVKSGFLSTHPTQPPSPSRLPLHPTISPPNQSDPFQQPQSQQQSLNPHSPQQPQPQPQAHSTVKASITQVNPDGTCTIRLENDEMKEVQFVTGRFQIPSQFKPGEQVNVSYPGSRSHTFPATISRGHPDGSFTVRYHNGTREMRLNPSEIQKRDSTPRLVSSPRDLIPSSPSAFPSPSKGNGDNGPPSVIAVADLEQGCETIEELNKRIPLYQRQADSLSKQLTASQQILNNFSDSLPSLTAGVEAAASGQCSFEERKRLRNEHFSHLHSSESSRRASLEKRIEEMKRFSIPPSLPQHNLSKHLNLFHYDPLIFAPIRKEIVSKYNSKKKRRQASFVIKRFFSRVLAWVKVVLAVRMLTRNRLAYKKKDRREKAALVIQSCARRKIAMVTFMKRKFSAVIILKAMKKRRQHFMRKKELEDQLEFLKLVMRTQRIFRWHRNQKFERLRRIIEKENEASLKIQSLFRRK